MQLMLSELLVCFAQSNPGCFWPLMSLLPQNLSCIPMVSSGGRGNPIIIQGPPISPGPPKLAVFVYGAQETEFRYQQTMKFDLNSRKLKSLN